MDALKCKFREKNQRTAIADLLTTPRKNSCRCSVSYCFVCFWWISSVTEKARTNKNQNLWRWFDAPNIRLFSSLADKKSTDG